ncbi:hypothetical protein, partial [Staphylococcus aureus]|uniref:hypothetical protein n=1 Tax=Staphylococcus aureus TaxID=1280 RepID=UPI0011A19A83
MFGDISVGEGYMRAENGRREIGGLINRGMGERGGVDLDLGMDVGMCEIEIGRGFEVRGSKD